MIMHVGVIAGLKVEYPRTKTIRAEKRHEALFLMLGHVHGVIDISKFHIASANSAWLESTNRQFVKSSSTPSGSDKLFLQSLQPSRFCGCLSPSRPMATLRGAEAGASAARAS